MTTVPCVALAGALDTKGAEYAFVRDRLASAGVASILIDTGVLGEPTVAADVTREAIAEAGGAAIRSLAQAADRGDAMIAMARGAAAVVRTLVGEGAASGVLVLGGSNAAYMMAEIAAALPIGVPKLLVSTVVAGDTRPYVRTSDLTMMYPIVDIAGLNSISVPVLARAADAMAGMVAARAIPTTGTSAKAPVACTMFGVTTTCVTAVKEALTASGEEVHTFHANGTGGLTLEAMIRSNLFGAIADITTTELADELCGGVCSAGPDRLDGAAKAGVPQVVSLGALDIVNFGARDTVPERYSHRLLYPHNPAVTLMRTTPEECEELGRIIARKLNAGAGPVEVVVPVLGFSQISGAGGPFHDPRADEALIGSLESSLDANIPVRKVNATINDPGFSLEITTALGRVLSHTGGRQA